MRIYIDLDLLVPVEAPAVLNPVNLAAKLMTAPLFELQFVQDGAPVLVPPGYIIEFALKPAADYNTTTLVYCPGDSWTPPTQPQTFSDGVTTDDSETLSSASASFDDSMIGAPIAGAGIPEGTTIEDVVSETEITMSQAATATATDVSVTMTLPDPDGFYTANPNFNTDPLLVAFDRDQDDGNPGIPTLPFNGEFAWRPTEDATPIRTMPFTVTVYDNVIDTDEGVPDSGTPQYPEASAIALLASPAFTGVPTAPTAAPGTNTTQLATTEFVQEAVTLASIATEAEAQAGTDNTHMMTPLRTAEAIAAQADAAGAAAAAQAASLQKSANLSDLANAGTARTNLGLGTAATQPSSAFDAAGAAAAAQAAAEAACATSAQGAEADALTAAFATSPIQPVNAIVPVLAALLDGSYNLSGTGHLDLSWLLLTAIDLGLIVQWLVEAIEYDGGAGQTIDLSGNALSKAQEDAIMAALLANSATSNVACTLNLSGGTNASVAVVPEIYTVDFSAVDVAAIIAGGLQVGAGVFNYSGGSAGFCLAFDPTIPLASSSTGTFEGSPTYMIGVQDSPTVDQIATQVAEAGGLPYQPSPPTVAGAVVTASDTLSADMPFSNFVNGGGVVLTEVQVFSADANVTSLVNNGWTLVTN